MSIPAWPSVLPNPNRSGYSLALGEGRMFTQDDAGPVRAGRKFSQVAKSMSLVIEVNRDLRAVFENFWFEDTKEGVRPFTMPDFSTDGWTLLDDAGEPLRDETGAPLLLAETWLCMFATSSTPQISVRGVDWVISFAIQVMP